ncbi:MULTISPECIES: potassium/proton antiporter [Clostridia]|uniref:potassium/proton antiporter n=1 Tax=Clostridia TaxID=186801 RepID=UPI000EA2C3D0|nr:MULTISPECIES: potassium/proton antiporter [Clostridia]NBJ68249.1 potassium/proton antiporter [Roseburia sp. 1XD42-34]RKI82015.1 potassium/proton antiporter [Clostridium sp. 1xD42-85]
MIPEIQQSNITILAISLILIFSILAVKFSAKVNSPSLVFFIAIGMVLGSDAIHLFQFSDPAAAQLIGMLALVIILFDGGIQTNWQSIRPYAGPALSLATVGVLLTSFIIGVTAKLLFSFSWPEAFLLGALVGSTDAAAVFAMLKGKNMPNNITYTLEAESGANDPMAVFLTTSLIAIITNESPSGLTFLGQFAWQMGGAVILGFIIGKFGSKGLHRMSLSSSGLYPLLALSFALFAYSFGSLLQTSGLLTVYIAAIVIGNHPLQQRHTILRFNEGISWIAQIGMFVLLGMFVIPSDLFSISIIIKGLLLSFTLMLVARPIATYIAVIGAAFNWKEKYFLSWAGLRGAVPIVLALFPMLARLEHSQLYFNIIFFIVLTSSVIQGTSLPWLGKKLGLAKPTGTNPLHIVDLLSVGKKELEVVEYQIGKSNRIRGKTIADIDFPSKANIILIVREGQTLSPTAKMKLRNKDIVYILIPYREISKIDALLRDERE